MNSLRFSGGGFSSEGSTSRRQDRMVDHMHSLKNEAAQKDEGFVAFVNWESGKAYFLTGTHADEFCKQKAEYEVGNVYVSPERHPADPLREYLFAQTEATSYASFSNGETFRRFDISNAGVTER